MSFNQIPPNPAVLIEELTMIIDEATDKAAVKQSIKARLNAAAQMSAPAPSNMSTMDTDIDDAIEPYESNADLLGEVASSMSAQLEGGRKRKTRRRGGKLGARRKSMKSRKHRKYSRRH
jgi:hypothetical protein